MNESLWKSWKFMLALALIFVSGKVVGYAIAVHRDAQLGPASEMTVSAATESAWSTEALQRLSEQLELSSEQRAALKPTVNQLGEKVLRERERALFQIHLHLLEAHDDIAKTLRPDQLPALDQSREQLKATISKRFSHLWDLSETPSLP